MANRSVLPELVAQVRAFWVDEGIDATISLGFQEAGRKDNDSETNPGNRVVIDLRSVKRKILPPKGGTTRAMQNGNRGRCLCTIEWSLPVHFWATDRGVPDDPENEIAQLEAYVTMFERTTQAVESYGLAAYHWEAGEVPKQPVERSFGRSWTDTLVILEDIYDVENGVALPGFTINPSLQRQV